MKKKKIENYIINLQECLGEGSFGKVYKGVNDLDKSSVAVKVLSKKLLDEDESFKDAYVEEIKIMRKLHSPHIVQFIDVIETENNFYIVQEFCNGGDLRSKINNEKQFSEAQSTEYLLQLLTGFIELMNNGVIHRDMKPQNILLHNKVAKIADFGFAKNVLSRSQLLKTLVGTPLYMSLQMLKNQKYTSKCDIWAIGLLYFEMLFGKVPWKGKSQIELAENIEKVPLRFPKDPVISDKARNFIEGCLKIEESDRFGWNQVYNHPILNGTFKEFISKHDRLQRKTKEIINQMRIYIHSQNLDLDTVFSDMNLGKQSSLKKQQFLSVVKTLYKDIDKEQFEFLFEKFDINKVGLVSFELFKKYLSQNGIRFKSLKNKKQEKPPEEKADKVIGFISKIKSKVEHHKLDLETVFNSYTKATENSLNYETFSKFALKIDNTLTEADIKACFFHFDANRDNRISFGQFSKAITSQKK